MLRGYVPKSFCG